MVKRKNQPVITDDEVEQVEQTIIATEVLPKWKVKSGGITLRDRRSFATGDTFEAHEHEIPTAFMNLLERVNPQQATPTSRRVTPKFAKEEIVPTAEEEDAEDYVQLYNIVSEKGKVITPKLTLEEANEILIELNA